MDAIISPILIALIISQINSFPTPVEASVIPSIEAKSAIVEKIELASDKYGVSYQELYLTIKCESEFQNVQSRIVKNGKREESYGIVQINLPTHPSITKEQALDVSFSIDWMAYQFSLGNQKKWTCWRNVFGSTQVP